MLSTILAVVCLTLVLFILRLYLLREDYPPNILKLYDSLVIIGMIILILILTSNTSAILFIGANIFTLSIIFKDFLVNLSSTILMYLFDPIPPNTNIIINPYQDALTYSSTGFLRSKLTNSKGESVLVPNRNLLNDNLIILSDLK